MMLKACTIESRKKTSEKSSRRDDFETQPTVDINVAISAWGGGEHPSHKRRLSFRSHDEPIKFEFPSNEAWGLGYAIFVDIYCTVSSTRGLEAGV